MEQLKILIVEDIVVAGIGLRTMLEKNGHFVTGISRTLSEACNTALLHPPDLALIDIMLTESGSEGDGIDTAQELLLIKPMPIIFLTSNQKSDLFHKAQQIMPSAYLLKPFNEQELLFNIELAHHNYRSPTQQPFLEGYMMLPVKGGHEMIYLDDVSYLKAAGAYSHVVMTDTTNYLVSTSLGQLQQYFNKPNFFRLSRTFLINLYHVKSMKDSKMMIQGSKQELPVPESARKELFRLLTVVRTKPMSKK